MSIRKNIRSDYYKLIENSIINIKKKENTINDFLNLVYHIINSDYFNRIIKYKSKSRKELDDTQIEYYLEKAKSNYLENISENLLNPETKDAKFYNEIVNKIKSQELNRDNIEDIVNYIFNNLANHFIDLMTIEARKSKETRIKENQLVNINEEDYEYKEEDEEIDIIDPLYLIYSGVNLAKGKMNGKTLITSFVEGNINIKSNKELIKGFLDIVGDKYEVSKIIENALK